MTRSRSLLSAGLFVALGLVGAFIASAVAGRGDAEPVESRPLGHRPVPSADLGDGSRVRVEVLNGAGTMGLARDATHALRGHGFDVVFFGNAGRFDHSRSRVIDRIGDPQRARAVAAALGIDSVITAIDSSLMLEVTVVLGDDWPPPAAPAPERLWLDRLRDLVRRDSALSDSLAPDVPGAGPTGAGPAAGERVEPGDGG